MLWGDVFRTLTDPKERTALTSSLKYVKRVTKKQAERVCCAETEQEDEDFDRDDFSGDLSESDEDPITEEFIWNETKSVTA